MPQTLRNPPPGGIMEKYNFKDSQIFEQLEDKAIDGQLDYSNFPSAEYKYFSKLAKLGYNNRHKGWNIKICLELQEKFKTEYNREKQQADEYLNLSKRIQKNIMKSSELVNQIYKQAKDKDEILLLALQTIECLTNEGGFVKRISKKINLVES